jgi:hypothetical protein
VLPVRVLSGHLPFSHMPRQRTVVEPIFLWCTVLTTLGSIAASLMEVIILLGVGWDELSFDSLLALTLLSTVGLLVGTSALLGRRKWSKTLLLLSSIYMPVSFLILTVRNFTPPLGWWPLLPLSLTDIFLAW